LLGGKKHKKINKKKGGDMMRKVFVGIFILFLVVSSAYAQDRGTAAEAKSLLSKAVAYYKANG